MDYLDQLGPLALGSRLKRLSDRMMSDASSIYRALGFDVQSRWFPLLALLSQQDEVSVSEATRQLGVTQPAISQFSRELQKAGLVQVAACQDDGRRKKLSLTAAGRDQVQRMQPMWQSVEKAAISLCDEAGEAVYQSIRRLEQALSHRSLLQRTLEYHHASQPETADTGV